MPVQEAVEPIAAEGVHACRGCMRCLSPPPHTRDISVRLQRGDAEMAQKLWRVVRACVELGPKNPIQQIHDQGAGGNCNVVSLQPDIAVGQDSCCPGYQRSKEDLFNRTT